MFSLISSLRPMDRIMYDNSKWNNLLSWKVRQSQKNIFQKAKLGNDFCHIKRDSMHSKLKNQGHSRFSYTS
jgi:hypothetical protein